MPLLETPPPALPPFIREELPYGRKLYRLERGPDAGRRIHFLDHGDDDAPPVLLVHGNPTWSFLWRKVVARLEDSFRCVAPDLLGLGLSDRLPKVEDHTLARHADAVAELVEALDLRRLILVGQDWGGPIAASVGARLPERVGAVVLGNTSVLIPKRLHGAPFHRFARMPLVSDFFFRVLGFPQRALHRVQGDPDSIRGDVAKAYRWPLRRFRDRVAPLALARMVPSVEGHPTLEELGKTQDWLLAFEGPMALVWGTKDPILGRALKRHREAFPRARVTETEAGHFLQEEVPGELADAIAWADRELVTR